jgi:transposase
LRSNPLYRDFRLDAAWRAKLPGVPGRQQPPRESQLRQQNRCAAQPPALPLLPWASRRRTELLQLLDQLEASIAGLDRAVAEQANARIEARRLMTHPGVGPVTALAFTLTMGPAERFPRGKQVASWG